MRCSCCGRELTTDETGLSRKLISRGTAAFYCLECLSRRFGVSPEELRGMIANFRASGCTLFSPEASDPKRK